jgi:hypothetical protein
LDEFLDLYLHIKKAVLRTALAANDKTGAVTSPGVLVLLQEKKSLILESQAILEKEKSEKLLLKRIIMEQEAKKRASVLESKQSVNNGSGGGDSMFTSAASLFGLGAAGDNGDGSQLSALANLDISDVNNFSLAEIPRRDRAAAIEQAKKIASAEKQIKVDHLVDGSYTVTFPPLYISQEKLGFQIREASKRWRCPTVHKIEQRGALRRPPFPGEMVLEVNGVEVNKKPSQQEIAAARSDDGGDVEVDFSAFDKCARLLVEGRALDQPLVVRFQEPTYQENDAFLLDSDDEEVDDGSNDEDDDVIDAVLKDKSSVENEGEQGGLHKVKSWVSTDKTTIADMIKQTSSLKKSKAQKEALAKEDEDDDDDDIGWSSEDEDVGGTKRRPGSAKDCLNDMPPGHVDSDDDTKEFFKKGDQVGWRGSDGEIPEGSIGTVIGFTEQGLLRVKFPYIGTFSMFPKELKEPVWTKADPWNSYQPPNEIKKSNDMSDSYDVIFNSLELNMKIMENVDRSRAPVVSKAFPGSQYMERGDVLVAIDDRVLESSNDRDNHRPFNLALDILSTKIDPPVKLSFAKPAPICQVTSVDGEPSMYDATFSGEYLGFDLGNFGHKNRVIRVVATHPIGIPHLGDQLIAIQKQSIINIRDPTINNNVLAHVERLLSSQQRPITLRFQRSSGEMAEGEMLEEARSGFSVLFMSKYLGLTFNLASGVPVLVKSRPLFSVPAPGDVLTAVNGAELSKCALPVSQLVLLLESLPRPIRLSFVEGSSSLLKGLKGRGRRRIDGHNVQFPEHYLKQVIIPPGRRVGLKLMTVNDRPVVQHVMSQRLKDQGVRPLDVLVSIKDRQLGEMSANDAVQLLKHAKWQGVNSSFKVGFLRMTPKDATSSYNSQHPIDIASALTSYHSESRTGILSFSIPFSIPHDKYKVEVFRYGSEIAPSIGAGNSFNSKDQYIRINDDAKPKVMTYDEAAEIERIGEGDIGKEKRLQLEGQHHFDSDLRAHEIEQLAKQHAEAEAQEDTDDDDDISEEDDDEFDDDDDDDAVGEYEDDFDDHREVTL